MSVSRAYGGLSNQKIRKELITFEANGVFTFQDVKFGVTMQLINNHA